MLYGYWVGATPDGRRARTMLNYGIDPRPEAVRSELPERLLSFHKLPFHRMTGGYASHIGISSVRGADRSDSDAEAAWMRDRIIKPLFRLGQGREETPHE